MNDESFKKMDESLMKALKDARHRDIPDEMLKDFATSVKKKIIASQNQRLVMGSGVIALTFVLIFIGITLWQFSLIPKPRATTAAPLQKADRVSSSQPSVLPAAAREELKESELLDEIEALEAIGLWTDEDEQAMDITLEHSFSELEMDTSGIVSSPSSQISLK